MNRMEIVISNTPRALPCRREERDLSDWSHHLSLRSLKSVGVTGLRWVVSISETGSIWSSHIVARNFQLKISRQARRGPFGYPESFQILWKRLNHSCGCSRINGSYSAITLLMIRLILSSSISGDVIPERSISRKSMLKRPSAK